MTKEKRDIQIKLDKLYIDYAEAYQHYNDLRWEIETNQFDNSDDKIILKFQKEHMDLLKEKLDKLSKQFKEYE